nr:hypothetical protein [Lachnospiraceae bacterium]
MKKKSFKSIIVRILFLAVFLVVAYYMVIIYVIKPLPQTADGMYVYKSEDAKKLAKKYPMASIDTGYTEYYPKMLDMTQEEYDTFVEEHKDEEIDKSGKELYEKALESDGTLQAKASTLSTFTDYFGNEYKGEALLVGSGAGEKWLGRKFIIYYVDTGDEELNSIMLQRMADVAHKTAFGPGYEYTNTDKFIVKKIDEKKMEQKISIYREVLPSFEFDGK